MADYIYDFQMVTRVSKKQAQFWGCAHQIQVVKPLQPRSLLPYMLIYWKSFEFIYTPLHPFLILRLERVDGNLSLGANVYHGLNTRGLCDKFG